MAVYIDMAASKDEGRVPISSWVQLGILALLYVFSFVDRYLLGVLAQPVAAEFGLSDRQLGLLLGAGFALCYALMVLPLARIADRGNRHRLILVAGVLWSMATLGTAFTTGFWSLLLCRGVVALGEAALTPAALSIISDRFPPHRRALAISIYLTIGMTGGGGSLLLGGGLTDIVSHFLTSIGSGWPVWRVTFIAAGSLTFLLIGILAIVASEPVRSSAQSGAPEEGGEGLLAYLRLRPSLFLGIVLGCALTALVGYSYTVWFPTYLVRNFHLTVSQSSYYYGFNAMIVQGLATMAMPFALAWALRPASRISPRWLIMGIILLGIASAVGMYAATSLAMTLAFAAGSLMLMAAVAAVVPVLAQFVVPSEIRARFVATYYTSTGLIGLGLGPSIVAFCAPLVDGHLGKAMALTGIFGMTTALACLFYTKPDDFRANEAS